jgi:hypothetical protein
LLQVQAVFGSGKKKVAVYLVDQALYALLICSPALNDSSPTLCCNLQVKALYGSGKKKVAGWLTRHSMHCGYVFQLKDNSLL